MTKSSWQNECPDTISNKQQEKAAPHKNIETMKSGLLQAIKILIFSAKG